MRHALPLFPLAVASLLAPVAAQAPLLVPSQFPDIGSAIQAAAPGAVIHVSPRVPPYPPFTIDRPVTIVGSATSGEAPRVVVSSGAAITVQLAAGQRAVLTRIDASPANGATLTTALVATGGLLTVEDCRFSGGHDPAGTHNLAAVDVLGTDLTLLFSRIDSGTATAALRATASRVALVASRCFGANPVGPGVVVQDSTLHGSEAWLLGGENFLGGPGAPALTVAGSSQVWLSDSTLRSGIGSPAGSALVNTTATPVELRNTTATVAVSLSGTPPPAVVGPASTNPNLLGLRWSEPLYRSGTLRLGQSWGVVVRGPAQAPQLLAFSFAPTATATSWTRQPALLPGEIVALFLVLTDATGQALFTSSVPNSSALIGAGLWAQAAGGASFPLEASPFAGAVVRPF